MVGGMEVKGLSDWGGGDGGGGGDGVGEGTGVDGLAGMCGGLPSKEIPASEGVVGRSSWASVLSGSVTDCDAPITSPCWS